jgi:hypothetical protein
MDPRSREPPALTTLHILRRHAETMFPGVCGAEGEFSGRGATLGDDAVVGVEGFFDGNEDAGFGLGEVGFCGVVPDFGVVVSWGVISVNIFPCWRWGGLNWLETLYYMC